MYKIIFTLTTALVLSGCGSGPGRFSPEKLPNSALSSTSGVALLSTGAEKECSGMGTATFLKILAANQSYSNTELALLPIDTTYVTSDFTTFHGSVHAVALPPGQYYLAPWFANPYVSAVRITRYDFEVKAREVTYLGRYYMSTHCGLSNRGEFSDQEAQDIELIRTKKPDLNLSSVQKQILKLSGIAVGK